MKPNLLQVALSVALSAGCATTGTRPRSTGPVSLLSVVARDMAVTFVVANQTEEAISICPVAWTTAAREGVGRGGAFGIYCGEASAYTRVESRSTARVTREIPEVAVSDRGEEVTIDLDLQVRRAERVERLTVRWTGKPR